MNRRNTKVNTSLIKYIILKSLENMLQFIRMHVSLILCKFTKLRLQNYTYYNCQTFFFEYHSFRIEILALFTDISLKYIIRIPQLEKMVLKTLKVWKLL